MTFNDNMLRAVKEMVGKVLQENGITSTTKIGTVVAAVAGNTAQVVPDGSTVAISVKVFAGVNPAEGDRVILMRVEGKWSVITVMRVG